jgi:hypothetical protein
MALNATAGIISLTQHDIIDEFDIANRVGDASITGTNNSVEF